ncbi:MAG: stage II sporulation protein P [Oscillospiraceae bacterium]|nr:stage II sporulation protein P [Oscillospiraceae bacterium]
MSTRKLLAAGSTLLLALRLLAGPGGGTADRLWRAGAAGLAEAARNHDADAVTITEAPLPTPEATPEPDPAPPQETPAQDTSDAAPTTAPDGRAILPTTLTGGMTIKNETDYAPDLTALLSAGPGLTLPADGPQVLIIHTHTSEAYTPDGVDRYSASGTARTEDNNYNIVRVGDALTDALTAQGLTVLHDRTIYDYPSYTGSYSRSGAAVEAFLAANPTIRIVIDLHRDALSDDQVVYKTLSELPDLACAQVMLLVGTNGSGLEHPDWENHLRLAAYLQNAVNADHPTLMRPIALVNERYNQHLAPGSILIEVGSSGNTLQEALRAVELFGQSAGKALAALIE